MQNSCSFSLAVQNIFVTLQRDCQEPGNEHTCDSKTNTIGIMRRNSIVEQVSQAIHRIEPSATAILYGSEARGEARADSDIDILILVDGDKLSIAREQEYTAPLYEIEWATGVQISPMVMLRSQWENRPFKTPFYLNIMKEGITL